MKVENYGTYTIRSALAESGGYIHIPFVKIDDTTWAFVYTACVARIWRSEVDIATTNGAADFVFIEADSDPTYYIVNRRSGLCLGLQGAANASLLWQAPYNPAMDAAFRFILEPAGEDFQLVNCLSGLIVLIKGGRPVHGAELLGWDPAEPAAGALSRFELERVADPVPVPMEESRPDPWLRLHPENWPSPLTSLTGTCQAGPPTIGATDVLPFFMVNDPGYSFRRQVEDSPYYEFTHSVQWTMIRDRVFDGRTAEKTVEATSVGMSRTAAFSLENTVKTVKQTSFGAGFDPEIEAKGVKAKGISAKFGVSKTASRETHVAIDTSAEGRVDQSTTEEVEYPALGYRYRIMTWRPMDVFELRRADHSLVDCWTSTRDDQEYVDFYPEKASARKAAPKA